MTFLDEVYADLLETSTGSPRSLQVETGASQVFGCRAETVMRLRGEPISDPKVTWQAEVGSAIDERLGRIRKARRPWLLVQERYTYRGVPCTVDEIDPKSEIGVLLTDWKTKDDAAAIQKVIDNGPERNYIVQVHLGAAAARESGVMVTYVQLAFLPRGGRLEDAYIWGPVPFDQALADEAAEWASEAQRLAGDPETDITTLRDRDAFWCRDYCERVTACRGPRPEQPELDDPELVDAVQRYYAAKLREDDAKAEKRQIGRTLLGVSGKVADLQVITVDVAGSETPDVDALSEYWRLDTGQPVPVKIGQPYSYVKVIRPRGGAK